MIACSTHLRYPEAESLQHRRAFPARDFERLKPRWSVRSRVVTEDLEMKFKDADDPLRIVFVCAMWMTGFDVPSCSTIYLDKPMRNHTLMQTIARANRVFGDKVNGLIVDYVGVFRSLQKALAMTTQTPAPMPHRK